MKDESIIKKEALKNIPLFSELNTGQLEQITHISKLEKYSKNKLLFLEGDSYRGFYIMLEGSVKIYKTSPEGKEVILHIIKPTFPFADVPLFEGGSYPANAQTLEDSIILFIAKDEFMNLILKNPEIIIKITAGFAKRLRLMGNQLEDITLKEVSNRLAKYILDEVKRNGTDKLPEPFLKLTISKSTIASLLGTITETLSRTFKKLQNENVIQVEGKKIFVTDFNHLKKLSK